jgi:hypothetical protein
MLVIVTYDVSTETPEGRPSSTFARSASPGQPAGRGLKLRCIGGRVSLLAHRPANQPGAD